MEIVIRLENGSDGVRRHYCSVLDAVVAADVDGVRRGAPVHCPLCGAVTSTEVPDVRGGDVDRDPSYFGPRCPHGFPDAPCTVLVREAPERHYAYVCGVPEYRIADFAPDAEARATLTAWAHPCGACRQAYVREHLPEVESAPRAVCRSLGTESERLSRRAAEVGAVVDLTHALLRDVLETARPAAQGPGGRGFVYAITDERAIKIGWTSAHPAIPGGRLQQLQTAHAVKLRLIGVWPGDSRLETQLHRRFEEHRIRGEWFRYASEIVEYFRPA